MVEISHYFFEALLNSMDRDGAIQLLRSSEDIYSFIPRVALRLHGVIRMEILRISADISILLFISTLDSHY